MALDLSNTERPMFYPKINVIIYFLYLKFTQKQKIMGQLGGSVG